MSSFNETIQRGSQSMLAIERDLSRVETIAKKNGHKPTSTALDRMFTINQQAKVNLKVHYLIESQHFDLLHYRHFIHNF